MFILNSILFGVKVPFKSTSLSYSMEYHLQHILMCSVKVYWITFYMDFEFLFSATIKSVQYCCLAVVMLGVSGIF